MAHPQRPLHDFQLRSLITRNGSQPTLIRLGIDALFHLRRFAQQRHGDLGTETGAQAQRILDIVFAAASKIQITQFWVRLELVIIVGNRRHGTVLQCLDRQHVLDAHTHCMAGITLGVGNDHPVRLLAEDSPQGMDFRRSAAAARRRISLVRDKDCLRRDFRAGDAKALFRLL